MEPQASVAVGARLTPHASPAGTFYVPTGVVPTSSQRSPSRPFHPPCGPRSPSDVTANTYAEASSSSSVSTAHSSKDNRVEL